MIAIRDEDLVFNIVLTGNVFRYLRYFVCSLIDQSDARFRLVANAVSDKSLALIQDFATRHPNQIVEVFGTAGGKMVGHGKALDVVFDQRDDGDFFSFVDPDIKANAPFMPKFRELLTDHAAVTSGREVWTDDNVVPPHHAGLGGRHFFDRTGFVYGCPHLAMYHRGSLDETRSRWAVGFGSGGPDLSEDARSKLTDMGHMYQVFDTGKIVNILLQGDGHSVCHVENAQLIHIGGLSHYLSPPHGPRGEDGDEPGWARFDGMESRLEVTRFTAAMLRDLTEERPAPQLPEGLDPEMEARLQLVRDEMIDLVETYRG